MLCNPIAASYYAEFRINFGVLKEKESWSTSMAKNNEDTKNQCNSELQKPGRRTYSRYVNLSA